MNSKAAETWAPIKSTTYKGKQFRVSGYEGSNFGRLRRTESYKGARAGDLLTPRLYKCQAPHYCLSMEKTRVLIPIERVLLRFPRDTWGVDPRDRLGTMKTILDMNQADRTAPPREDKPCIVVADPDPWAAGKIESGLFGQERQYDSLLNANFQRGF